jgi:UDP-N-acetylmuramoyl-L-alanyl-D-glutamate--2,6-diaminopimelate ligase
MSNNQYQKLPTSHIKNSQLLLNLYTMYQQLKNFYHLLQSFGANLMYEFPAQKLKVIGVTGTSGKTTTALLIYHILKSAGYKVSVLSSLKAVIGGKEYDTGFHVTTPDPHVLPKYLKQAVDNGDEYFVLEVSSHALDQNRAAFVPFEIGVLTSFAHEHLDYHKTLENYAIAKFTLLHAAKLAIVSTHVFDNLYPTNPKESKETLKKKLKTAVAYEALESKMRTFGIDEGDETQKAWKLQIPLPGEFNLLNGLAAATVGASLGIDKGKIRKAIKDFPGIPGRFEKIKNDRGFEIIIDFAHKPDALEGLLKAVKSFDDAQGLRGGKGRVIVMFGAASERDTLKRPIMGEISGRLADITVLTDEDPRREKPMKILDEIAVGCEKGGANECQMSNIKYQISNDKKHVYYKIPDRREAIGFIINSLAKKGDIVLLCGKGHERSMNYNGKELPWSEHGAVAAALKKVS